MKRLMITIATTTSLIACGGEYEPEQEFDEPELAQSKSELFNVFQIRNEYTNRCLHVFANGFVTHRDCNGSSAQRWNWTGPSDQPMLFNARTETCLADVGNDAVMVSCGSSFSGSARLWTYLGWPWASGRLYQGTSTFDASTDRCLRAQFNGDQVRMSRCINSSSRRWFFE